MEGNKPTASIASDGPERCAKDLSGTTRDAETQEQTHSMTASIL